MSAPEWKSAAQDFVHGNQDSSLGPIVEDVKAGHLKLVELVEGLRDYLTSGDVTVRCRGTSLLSGLINKLSAQHLNTQEVDVLVAFFSDRLKDHHSITPQALHGLKALSECSGLTDEGVQAICNSIFKEVTVQSLSQADRRTIYNILQSFLIQKLTALQKFGNSFVYSYIQVMDGEKDPRNLLIAFRSVVAIIQHFQIGMFAEELFEVTSCYFPIDFTPPPNDPYGVTREELIISLRHVLAATPLFGQYCFPLIMEKAASDITAAKIDSYDTLAVCIPVYGIQLLNEYNMALWNAIKNEVLSASNTQVEQATLGALNAAVKTYSDSNKQSSSMDGFGKDFLDSVCKDCHKGICNADLKVLYPNSKLIESCLATPQSCQYMLNKTIPVILEQFHTNTQPNRRRNILDILLRLIRRAQTFHDSTNNPIGQHKDPLVTLFISILNDNNSQLRNLGVCGLAGMAACEGLLNASEVEMISEHMLQLLLNDHEASVRQESTAAIAYIASKYPAMIQEKVLPALNERLTQEPMETETEIANNLSNSFILETMAAICTEHSLVKPIVQILVQYMKRDVKDSPSLSIDTYKAAECVLSVVKQSANFTGNVDFYTSQLMPDLIRICVHSAIDGASSTNSNEGVLTHVAAVLRTIVQQLSQGQALSVLGTANCIFLEGNLESINITSDQPFLPLEVSSPEGHHATLPLFTAIVCSLPSNTRIEDLRELCEKVYNLCKSTLNIKICEDASKCLAGLLNKYLKDAGIQELLGNILEDLGKSIEDADNETTLRCHHVTTWTWITKALVLSAHMKSMQFTKEIVKWFEYPLLGSTSAEGFYVILNEYDDIMLPTMHADVKILYRQRFFQQTLPILMEGFNNTKPEFKQHYLTGLSHLLRFLPKQVLKTELPPLMPMLVQSLCCNVTSLQLATMGTLYDLLFDAPMVLAKYAESTIPQVQKLTKHQPSMKVRILALQCLGLMTTLPHHILFPFKSKILHTLGEVVDDKKRLVRKEAVKARTEWYLLGAPSTKT
ncbi:unnamed protein product [Owenia fusiformis]|uniref:MMS19 nucleotide excision repair protein n=1 Tax=Owenia fusiformis TaxID=6347 RepID=A0A8S4NTU0_OWEFU|nr:unnamed protein product [Owenia fusiformis]